MPRMESDISHQVQRLVVDHRRPDLGFESIMFSRTHAFAFADRNGRLQTEQFRLDAATLRIARVSSTGHRITLSEDADATLLAPRSGMLSLRVAGKDRAIAAGEAALMPPQQRQTVAQARQGEGFLGDVLMMSMSDLATLAEQVGAAPPGGRDFRPVRGPAAIRLVNDLGDMLTTLGRGQAGPEIRVVTRMSVLLRESLAAYIAAPAEDDGMLGGRGTGFELARVRQAEAFIRAHAADPLSSVDLARHLGINLRSLQLAFQKVHGTSPRSYLTRVRLEAARNRLLLADPDKDSVTAIALESGFTHLGRFAGEYARTFGESAKATLSRRRARPVKGPHQGATPMPVRQS